MKIKKLTAGISFMVVLAILCGCSYINDDALDIKIDMTGIPSKNVPLTELTVYEFKEFNLSITRFSGAVTDRYMGSKISNLHVFDNSNPVEHVKMISHNRIWVVYRCSYEEYEDVLLYIEFALSENGSERIWETTGQLYFVKYELSSKDFEDVKIGDHFENVQAIDPCTVYDIRYNGNGAENFSYKLLSDGIMIIKFTPNSDDKVLAYREKDYSVTEISFYPYSGNEFPEKIKIADAARCIEYLSRN